MKKVSAVFVVLMGLVVSNSFAQPTAVQVTSSQQAQREMAESDRRLRQRIERPRRTQEIQTSTMDTSISPDDGSQRVVINSIEVSGNTALSQAEIDQITTPFEGQSLALKDMQKVADLLTDAYRQKGYITTRVVLPPQQVTDSTLTVQVVQGTMGNLTVNGNRYFRDSAFSRKIGLSRGEAFDYDQLRNNLRLINEHPDRNARAVLTPGQNPGETDVVLNVEDRLPMHLTLSYDNFASRYLDHHRYTGTLSHNNLFGFDDILTLQYQQGTSDDTYRLTSGRYLFPVAPRTQVGLYAAHNYIELQEEFEAVNARGKSKLYSAFVNHTMLDTDTLRVTGNAGFDYKDVFNFVSGVESSRDRLRIAKLGLNLDGTDPFYGRNIVNNDLSIGIPDILGGLDSVDARSSRVGAGGKFLKDVLTVLRLQELPADMSLFLKGEAQFADRELPAVEQYQLGGIANVRGFDPGEAAGDTGESFTAELNVPLYFIPRDMQMPFSRAKVYDAVRVAAFFDAGHVRLRNPQAGESRNRNLNSVGLGLRFNLPEDFSFRVDYARATHGSPSDDKKNRVWFAITKTF